MSITSELTALADAIRSKSGVSGKLTIPGMTDAVDGIETGGAIKFYECASYNATGNSWAGYEVTQNSDTGVWKKSNELTSGLTVGYLTPIVGEIYSADTAIRVCNMFDGHAIPVIPQDGLVFYAPLQEDYVDIISGKSANRTWGEFITFKGVKCLHLDGAKEDDYDWEHNCWVSWEPRDYGFTDNAVTMVALIAPVNSSSVRAYSLLSNTTHSSTSSRIALFAFDNNPLDWGGKDFVDNKWQSYIVTRNASKSCKAYIDGIFSVSGSSNFNANLASPAQVFVGGDPTDGYYDGNVAGYVAYIAIYNRELSADEVLEVHNALMEGVQQ